jgi:hypothetical protein
MKRRKRFDTLVGTLRQKYGEHFAEGFRSDAQLGTVLREKGVDSLTQLLREEKQTSRKGASRMARKAFFSFHYKPDNWRASQVRNMGMVEGNAPVSDNDWESVTSGGDAAIENWIANQLSGRSCTIVLVGEGTAGRKWITHEIIKSWNAGKGVLGIRIHNLKSREGYQTNRGANPFDHVTLKSGKKLSSVVKLYDPPYSGSTDVYNYISENIAGWVDEAITSRS